MLSIWLPSADQTVIRSTTRLVQVNVAAEDRKGQPAGDLTREDFTVLEDGKPQTLAVFAVEKGESMARPGAALPAGFFSNRLEFQGGVPNSVTVLLFDLLNTPPQYFGKAAPKIARFLMEVNPRYRIAIYALGHGGVRVLHDFTTDSVSLTKKLSEVQDPKKREIQTEMSMDAVEAMARMGDPSKSASALAGSGSGMDLMAALIVESAQKEQAFYQGQGAVLSADALAAVARRLAGIPGRKNLVWVSTGFSSDPSRALPGFQRAFDRAIRALGDASVTVYAVDARGLLGYFDNAEFSSAPGPGGRGNAITFNPSVTDQQNTLKQVANLTGGRLYFGSEVDEALPQVFEHSRVSYTLGYYPANPKYDGRFRRIAVKTARKGIRLNYRPGYFAAADAPATAEQVQAELAGTVWSPIDATAVGLNAHLEHSGTGGRERTLVTHVAGESLVFEPGPNGYACRLELYVVQKDEEGKQLKATLDRFDFPVAEAQMDTMRRDGVANLKKIELLPETEIIRLVVRNGGGALGSLSISLAGR
jgi:VWFA-related protein